MYCLASYIFCVCLDPLTYETYLLRGYFFACLKRKLLSYSLPANVDIMLFYTYVQYGPSIMSKEPLGKIPRGLYSFWGAFLLKWHLKGCKLKFEEISLMFHVYMYGFYKIVCLVTPMLLLNFGTWKKTKHQGVLIPVRCCLSLVKGLAKHTSQSAS